jgi:hypothetical protein
MLPYRDTRLTKIVVGIFFIIVIAYAYYEARGLLFGPSISITGGESAISSTQYVLIQGQATHIALLSVDGEPIQVTETGIFKEPYVLAPGANRIVFDAKDKYGHTTEKIVEIVYLPGTTALSNSQQASTTIVASTTQSIVPAITTTTSNVTASSSNSLNIKTSTISPHVAPGR